MRRTLLALTVGLALTGCGTTFATQCDCKHKDKAAAETMSQPRTIVLAASSPIQLVGPDGAGNVQPAGLPDMAGMAILLSADGKVGLMTSDGQIRKARTHVEGNKVMFGVDLPDGADISGVLHVQEKLPIVAALILTDREGRIFSGRQEFMPSRSRAGSRTGGAEMPVEPSGDEADKGASPVPGMTMAAGTAFSGDRAE
jgi:hypothetical protein